jgi:hypothetical protein
MVKSEFLNQNYVNKEFKKSVPYLIIFLIPTIFIRSSQALVLVIFEIIMYRWKFSDIIRNSVK